MNQIAILIAELRIIVGFLGEKQQANWWGSEFFSESATTFLAPIFNRSLFLAQYQGATAAAAKVHDDDIGIGHTYHLFRLPIGLEQASSDVLNDRKFTQALQGNLGSREQALTRLAELATKQETASPGPLSLGLMQDDLGAQLQRAAGVYHSAFKLGIKSFPYLREA